jgi:hypothetical protein
MNLPVLSTSLWMWFVLAPVYSWITQTPIGRVHVDLCTYTTLLTILGASFHFLPHFEIFFHGYSRQRTKSKFIFLQNEGGGEQGTHNIMILYQLQMLFSIT